MPSECASKPGEECKAQMLPCPPMMAPHIDGLPLNEGFSYNPGQEEAKVIKEEKKVEEKESLNEKLT